MVDAPLTPQGMTIRDVHLPEPPSCPRKWPWKFGGGDFPGLLPFSADRLEMTSRNRVEIREAAISTFPPFPPPMGDRPTLNVVGQPRAVGAEPTAGAQCRPLCLGVRSHHGRARQTAITLRQNGRPLSPHTCSRPFVRRDRADAGGAPAVPPDGISPRPSREFRIS
jgi:hypothetical protein